MNNGEGKLTVAEEINATRAKFNTALWKFISYVFLSTVGIIVLKNSPWIFQREEWGKHEAPIGKVHLYYILATSYYLYSTFSIFFEPKMKDRNQMFIHHLATLTLLITSHFGDKMR
jgi:hypothetical protein